MRWRTNIILLLSVSLLSTTLLASDDGFYKRKQEGWFWHETPPEQPKEEAQKPVEEVPAQSTSTTPTDPNKKVTIDVQWLRENMDRIRDAAINNPTEDNLGVFYGAQRVMLDLSSRFATESGEFFKQNPWMSEDNRRPTETFALRQFRKDAMKQVGNVIADINKHSGLWVFFSSTCPHCKNQIPIMTNLARLYGVDILYISLDGGTLPGIPPEQLVFDIDGQVASDFNVEFTPTTFLVSKDKSAFKLVSSGTATVEKIAKSMIDTAWDMNWITKAQYASTKNVRDLNTVSEGNVELTQAEINDPAKLLGAIKARINLSQSSLGTPYVRRSKEVQQ